MIFLATDSADAAKACAQLTDFKCITIAAAGVRETLDSKSYLETRTDVNHVQLTLFALADWLTHRDFADMFVGSQSSFSEIALHLIRSRVGGHTPFINVHKMDDTMEPGLGRYFPYV